MSFFEGFKRALQGRPAYDDPVDQAPKATAQIQPKLKPNGQKYLPRLEIERISCRLSGSKMQIYGLVKNNSTGQQEVDKVKILGTIKELDSFLRPSESRDYLLFDGERPRNENYKTCEIHYRDSTGDYFSAHHTVYYRKCADGTFEIHDLKFAFIKDI